MKQDEKQRVGGCIDRSLKGETSLNMKALLHEAWVLTRTRKGSLLQGALLIVGVVILCIALLERFFDVQDWAIAPPNVQLSLQIIVTVITAPLVAAMFMTGISHSVGGKPAFSAVLRRIINSALIVVLAISLLILVYIGSALFLLPGIYLGLATGFSMMLYVEKQLTLSQSILKSIRVFNRYWLPLSLFYVGSFTLFALGMFTFGIAYIWIIPFYFNFKGVLYRELFGINVTKSETTMHIEVDSIFHA